MSYELEIVLEKIIDNQSSISGGYTEERQVRFKGKKSDDSVIFSLILKGDQEEIANILKELNVIKIDEMCTLQLKKTNKQARLEEFEEPED